jgi:TATA-box binding protein (TBP) (component of TFIID and TFIIIB)
MLKPKVVLLIFVSGKIVLTGAKVKTFIISFLVGDSWIIPR